MMPVSIHSSHTGRDDPAAGVRRARASFNPLFPYGKRPPRRLRGQRRYKVSIHSSHTGRDRSAPRSIRSIPVSIHSSHTGRDKPALPSAASASVSIHSSHTGRDRMPVFDIKVSPQFQSTLPIREETERRICARRGVGVSIHSSHTGRDAAGAAEGAGTPAGFNPLFPYGKRRCRHAAGRSALLVSIHSSHTGRDCPVRPCCPPPAGRFQSTLPIREETAVCAPVVPSDAFQSTLPIREETYEDYAVGKTAPEFQSTLPIREETHSWAAAPGAAGVSIHSSHTGRDAISSSSGQPCTVSIHSSHTGRDPLFLVYWIQQPCFNPLFPYGKRPGGGGACLPLPLFQSTLPIREETANAYNLSARKVVASAQHRHIFDSSLLFPAVRNWFLG